MTSWQYRTSYIPTEMLPLSRTYMHSAQFCLRPRQRQVMEGNELLLNFFTSPAELVICTLSGTVKRSL